MLRRRMTAEKSSSSLSLLAKPPRLIATYVRSAGFAILWLEATSSSGPNPLHAFQPIPDSALTRHADGTKGAPVKGAYHGMPEGKQVCF